MHETEPKHPRAILWNAIFSDNELSARNWVPFRLLAGGTIFVEIEGLLIEM